MKSTPSARHRARKLAVQALYQLHFLQASPSQVIKEFLEDNDLKRADVITESVDLAKIFGATDSYKYVNSILDRLATTFRSIEVGALQVR